MENVERAGIDQLRASLKARGREQGADARAASQIEHLCLLRKLMRTSRGAMTGRHQQNWQRLESRLIGEKASASATVLSRLHPAATQELAALEEGKA